jgi:hypothetical protein
MCVVALTSVDRLMAARDVPVEEIVSRIDLATPQRQARNMPSRFF